MGITNRRLHDLQRITVTGRVALTLIATTTKTMSLCSNALKQIGNLVVFLSKSILPKSPRPDCFRVTDPNERLYVNQFCKQLHISHEDMNYVGFHALSVLVNRDLNPHYDSMNPNDPDQDFTLSVSVQIPTYSLPELIKKQALDMYGTSIPLCIVLYKRKSLVHLCKRMSKLNTFENSETKKVKGRSLLRKLLHAVYTDADFSGRFFEKNQWELQQSRFEDVTQHELECLGITKLYVSNESVDKMAYWSPLLHVFYLYARTTNCLSSTDIISFALFFSHQCSGTLMIVQAMMRIIRQKDINDLQSTLYHRLVRECLEIKGTPMNLNITDVGMSPKYPRHGPSGQKPFTDHEVMTYCTRMNNLLHSYSDRMSELTSDNDKYHLMTELILDIMAEKKSDLSTWSWTIAFHPFHQPMCFDWYRTVRFLCLHSLALWRWTKKILK